MNKIFPVFISSAPASLLVAMLAAALASGLAPPRAAAADASANGASAPPANPAPAASGAAPTGPSLEGDPAEKVNVESIKRKYWARGDESEMGVVQNRAYSKAGKVEVNLFGGFVSTDPFLSVKNAGLGLAYHFNEYLAAEALWFRDFTSPSSALKTFQQTLGATTNYNAPQDYYGGELVGSILYGKLSLLGKSILYYDLHLLGGLGVTLTDNGNYLTEHLGVGQQVYLTKRIAFRVDYRAMLYNEDIIEKVIPSELGMNYGKRANWSHVITVGFSFLIGNGSDNAGGDK